ncbi:hypothetical protein SRHO_G00146130 [Serrasalmus rhombeus]
MRLLLLPHDASSPTLDVHDCETRLAGETSIRPDVSSTPLPSGVAFYVDGSCSKPSDGVFLCGYTVCAAPDTVVESFSLPFTSAQAAELYAITHACILAQDQDVTIYTDSRYAFGVVHDFGGIWHQRGFVTTDNKPISHASLIEDLIRASFLPSRLAVVKVRAHQRSSDPDSVGIDSDKGIPFTSKVTQMLAKHLSIDWAFHIPYHPQSSGMVERVNRTIKGRLRKAMQTQNTTNWVKVLPVVLAELRMVRTDTLGGLSPYEIVMGRPPRAVF